MLTLTIHVPYSKIFYANVLSYNDMFCFLSKWSDEIRCI